MVAPVWNAAAGAWRREWLEGAGKTSAAANALPASAVGLGFAGAAAGGRGEAEEAALLVYKSHFR